VKLRESGVGLELFEKSRRRKSSAAVPLEMFLKILPPEVNSFFLRLVVREHCEKMLVGGSDSPCLLGFMLELLQLVSFCANDAMKYLVF
jgi:hypothetical protein